MRVFFASLALLFWFAPPAALASSVKELTAKIAGLQGGKSCRTDADCRYAGVGRRPCGGPRYYLVYSVRDAEEKELLEVLGQLEELEKKEQRQGGMMGICTVAPEPQVSCIENQCAEKPKKDPDLQ